MRDSAAPSDRKKLGGLLRGVVKVLAVSDPPDYDQPWQTEGADSSFGSGVVVSTSRGLRILTNAHCVQDHVYVEVRRYGLAKKYQAEVEALGHDCDLALLSVDDEAFFAGVTPMPVGPLPELGDTVSVCGFPVGGERVSITRGIVSRIDLVRYEQSNRLLLALQIDAAINSGNSGGPVIRGNHLVGVAFQSLDDAEQVGYVIAGEVVAHFLADVDQGDVSGFPALGAWTQELESTSHRAALGLPEDRTEGVLIRRVEWQGSAWGVLEEGDVLLEVDGEPIQSDGTVCLRDGELVDFSYVFSRRLAGEVANVRVWRRGAVIDCVMPLKVPRLLVPEEAFDVRPTYYIFGGLLFVPLTKNYLKTYGDPWWQTAPKDLMLLYEEGLARSDYRQAVVLQKVLADRVNQGYHHIESLLMKSIDGIEIGDIRELIDVVESGESRYVELVSFSGHRLVLDRPEALERSEAILERFGVPRDRSTDLVADEDEDDARLSVDRISTPQL
jgi:S1-C subfamily serine protease